MPENVFHFAAPWWLFGLLAILPLAWWYWHSAQLARKGPIHLYADPHLLPHLTGTQELGNKERWGRFGRWALSWTLAILAMAGPRWDYEDVHLFQPGNNLLVLLDISRSMQVTDISPSRIERAKQELQDLLILNRFTRIGLIAFASVPYVISPITEDMATIGNALPYIDTDLLELQGSRLVGALERAEALLAGLPAESAKTILLISDGDFDEQGIVDKIRELGQKKIKFITLGVGTAAGGEVPDKNGTILLNPRSRKPVISVLNSADLTRFAEAGGGFYQEASFRQADSWTILDAAAQSKDPKDSDDITRIWHERFFLLLIPLLGLILPAFRHPQQS